MTTMGGAGNERKRQQRPGTIAGCGQTYGWVWELLGPPVDTLGRTTMYDDRTPSTRVSSVAKKEKLHKAWFCH